jgi:SOS-response transcriptional repressor LexA
VNNAHAYIPRIPSWAAGPIFDDGSEVVEHGEENNTKRIVASQATRIVSFGTLNCMSDTPSTRLRLAREKRKFATATDAAKAHGWNEVTYRAHEDGSRRAPPYSAVKVYAAAFRVPVEWILEGQNAPDWATEERPTRQEPRHRVVPKVSLREATTMPQALRSNHAFRETAVISQVQAFGPNVFVVALEDDSMRANPPTGDASFRQGDLVTFDPDQSPKPGDFVLAHIDGQEAAIFRKYRPRGMEAGKAVYELMPLNGDFATEVIGPNKAARIIGRLVLHSRTY